MRNWLDGDGSDVNFYGGRWGDFISSNEHVQARFNELAWEAINNGSMTIKSDANLALTNYNGGYSNGYELINGSNRERGGFMVNGTVSYSNGGYQVDVRFSFNDIIDVNATYLSDSIYGFGASILGYKCNDYSLSIHGNYNFYIKREN